MAIDTLFQSRTMVEAINKIPTSVQTKALDLVFGRKKLQTSGIFMWDIKSSSERLLSNIRVSDAAQVKDQTGIKTITCESPRFAEKRFISAADLENIRRFGDQNAAEILAQRLNDELTDMKCDIDRTREFMAIKALSGTVVDEAGATLVDYGFDSSQKPVLTSTAKWTDAASDPIKNIRGWKKWIGDRLPAVDNFVAIAGASVMDALTSNSKVLELMKYNAGTQIAQSGRISSLVGVNVDEYFGTYKTSGGTITQLVPDNVFILVGLGTQNAAELYAPVVDFRAGSGGVGGGGGASMFFSKSWEVEDPSGRWVKVEARPLPVLFQPECVVYATVV